MFSNIGSKIKSFAMVLCWIGIVTSVISTIIIWASTSRYNSTIGLGFLVLIFGCLGSWVGSFITYGLGELIDETTASREATQQTNRLLEKLLASQNNMAPSAQHDNVSTQSASAVSNSILANPARSHPSAQSASVSDDTKEMSAKASGSNKTSSFAGCSCVPITLNDSEIKCRFCGVIQRNDRKVCYNCEAKFI